MNKKPRPKRPPRHSVRWWTRKKDGKVVATIHIDYDLPEKFWVVWMVALGTTRRSTLTEAHTRVLLYLNELAPLTAFRQHEQRRKPQETTQ